jgi:hypothetical protein
LEEINGDLLEADLWIASILAHQLAFYSAPILLGCTMSKLMGRRLAPASNAGL